MSRRLPDKVIFGSDYLGWSPGQCCDEWEMQGFKPAIIEKLSKANITRILKFQDEGEVAQNAKCWLSKQSFCEQKDQKTFSYR